MLAVRYDSTEALDYFLSQPLRWRVDLKAKNKDGYAAIHLAVKQRNQALFDIIAKHSASLVVPVGIQYAYPSPANIPMYEDTLTLLAQLGPGEDFLLPTFKRVFLSMTEVNGIYTLNTKKAMLYACSNNNAEVVKWLVGFGGFDLNQTQVNKRSPLYAACEGGHVDLAIWLVQRFEIDVNLQCDDSNKTALYISAERGYSLIVEELVKRPDIEVNKFTAGKKTPLYAAIERGNTECVRHILKKCKQADLYLETSYCTTPLFIA